MRVARVITRLNRGGPARTLLAVEPLLRERGVESLLLTGEVGPGEEDLAPDFERAGVAVRRVPELRRELKPWNDLRALRHLEAALADFRPDVVHTHTFKAGCLGRLARVGPNVRRVHTFHGHLFSGAWPGPAGRLLAAVERRLARRTDLVLSVSERVRAELCGRWRIIAPERTAVLPGVLLPELALPADAAERAAARALLRAVTGTELASFDGAPWTGTLARLTAVKAPFYFLDVAAAVRARRPDARFVWVGDGDLRARFLTEIHRRGLAASVHWVGWQRDVRPWHLGLDVEALLSDQEGLPLALVEAKALRVPIVASAVGGVADLVREGIDGTLVRKRDAAAAAAAIVAAFELHLDGRDGRDGPSDGGGLSPSEHAQRLLRHYEEILRGPPVAA